MLKEPLSIQLSDGRAILQGWSCSSRPRGSPDALPPPPITPCEWRQRQGFGLLKQNSHYPSHLCRNRVCACTHERAHTHTPHTHTPLQFLECSECYLSFPELRQPDSLARAISFIPGTPTPTPPFRVKVLKEFQGQWLVRRGPQVR